MTRQERERQLHLIEQAYKCGSTWEFLEAVQVTLAAILSKSSCEDYRSIPKRFREWIKQTHDYCGRGD